MCPLWTVPSNLSDLCRVRGGDGLAAWADLPHAGGRRGQAVALRSLSAAHLPVLGLPGLRNRLSFGSAIWSASRRSARSDRASRRPPLSASRQVAARAGVSGHFTASDGPARSGKPATPVPSLRSASIDELPIGQAVAARAPVGVGTARAHAAETGLSRALAR